MDGAEITAARPDATVVLVWVPSSSKKGWQRPLWSCVDVAGEGGAGGCLETEPC